MSLFQKKAKVEVTDLNKRFDLIGRVGQGSMSKVWRADDAINGRFVAVKLLDKEKTARFESRFKGLKKPSEGDIALSLQHPNIVQTYEVGHTAEEEMFLVMEYVEGCGLSLLVDLQSDRMIRYRTRYMIQIGEALKYFHEQQWIHRDICPRNIMVTEDNQIKLIDFGLTVPNTPEFRKPGNRTGTANYMAPELIKRQPTDQRIDVFSYAVTCFEMYTKRHPWDAAMTIDAVLQHINKPPLQIAELVPRIDSQIAEAIMKGLEANPADRWQSIDVMMQEFREAERRLVRATRELLKRREAAEAGGQESAGSKGKKKKKPTEEGAADRPTQKKSSAEQTEPADPDGIFAPVSEDTGPKKPSAAEDDGPLVSTVDDDATASLDDGPLVPLSDESDSTRTSAPDVDDNEESDPEDEVLSLE